MSEIKGLLFDKDGTLIEFEQMWLGVAKRVVVIVAAKYAQDKAVNETELLSAIGVENNKIDFHGLLACNPVEDMSKKWFEMLNPTSTLVLFNEDVKQTFLAEALASPESVKALSGVKETLESFKRQGFKLGVATADSKDSTLYTLEKAGLLELFDFVGYSDGDIAPKPDSALMERFCLQCQLKPEQVAMFGDTLCDMSFGRNSGAKSIGVLSGTSTHSEIHPFADLVISSVADLTLGHLQQLEQG